MSAATPMCWKIFRAGILFLFPPIFIFIFFCVCVLELIVQLWGNPFLTCSHPCPGWIKAGCCQHCWNWHWNNEGTTNPFWAQFCNPDLRMWQIFSCWCWNSLWTSGNPSLHSIPTHQPSMCQEMGWRDGKNWRGRHKEGKTLQNSLLNEWKQHYPNPGPFWGG